MSKCNILVSGNIENEESHTFFENFHIFKFSTVGETVRVLKKLMAALSVFSNTLFNKLFYFISGGKAVSVLPCNSLQNN